LGFTACADSGLSAIRPQDTDTGEPDATHDSSQSEQDETDLSSAPDPRGDFAFYRAGGRHSPMNAATVARVQELLDMAPALRDDVFMKAGDSITVHADAVSCFATDPVDLDRHGVLQATLDTFLFSDVDGTTPFDRDSLAALGAQTAAWAISDQPPRVIQEVEAIQPRWALTQFGTNDMRSGATFAEGVAPFGEDLWELADLMVQEGVVPILLSIPSRENLTDANLWVPTYNVVIRSVVQRYQTPFADLHHALAPLPGQGLHVDGVHLNTLESLGEHMPCDLSDAGLDHGNNQRNLLQLEALDRALAAVDGALLDPEEPPYPGDGTPDDPFPIDWLPFVHHGDTSVSSVATIDHYTGCDADQDESGAEVWYVVELHEPTSLRAAVIDRGVVDVDIHILDDSATGEGCLDRDHHLVDTTLEPGAYFVVVDTYVADGAPLAGEFLLVLVGCEPDDPDCR